MTKPKIPPGLSKGALAWWRSIIARCEFSNPAEEELLAQAARCLSTIQECDAAVKREGMTVIGGRGLLVTHPLLKEARQQRQVFAGLVYRLGLHGLKEKE